MDQPDGGRPETPNVRINKLTRLLRCLRDRIVASTQSITWAFALRRSPRQSRAAEDEGAGVNGRGRKSIQFVNDRRL